MTSISEISLPVSQAAPIEQKKNENENKPLLELNFKTHFLSHLIGGGFGILASKFWDSKFWTCKLKLLDKPILIQCEKDVCYENQEPLTKILQCLHEKCGVEFIRDHLSEWEKVPCKPCDNYHIKTIDFACEINLKSLVPIALAITGFIATCCYLSKKSNETNKFKYQRIFRICTVATSALCVHYFTNLNFSKSLI
jgi:hypothetical protein